MLFVCLGNICRSPTAEGVMLHLLADAARSGTSGGGGVHVDSAGTVDHHVGDAPDARTIAHAKKRGYDLSALRARQVAAADFVVFDRIYGMDQNNVRRLRALAPPEHAHKIALFLDVLGEPGREVPDPWAGGPQDFEHVLDLCERGCRALLERLSPSRA